MTNSTWPAHTGGQTRCLDLRFDGKKAVRHSKGTGQNESPKQNTPLNNGFRPHGGFKGLKQHPPSMYSFNKPEAYHQEIQAEVERLMETEATNSTSPPPKWVMELNGRPTHSPQSPLFTNNFISPKKSEQQADMSVVYHKLRAAKSAPSGGRQKKQSIHYYHPNSAHHYLSNTDISDSSQRNTNLGRPTRTTLLRDRQRCNSAPVNSYESRREAQKRNQQKDEFRKALINNLNNSLQSLMNAVPRGESRHGYLLGARYNRAHYLDAKSLTEYGVYMPRNNPQTVFVVSKPTSTRKESSVPSTESDAAPVTVRTHTAYVSTHPDLHAAHTNPASSPPGGTPSQAWAQQTSMEVSQSSDSEDDHSVDDNCNSCHDNQTDHHDIESKPCHDNRLHNNGSHSAHAKRQVINLTEGLNVSGVGFSATRCHSQGGFRSGSALRRRRPQANKGLPSVYIQGTSVTCLPTDTHGDSLVLDSNPSSSRRPDQPLTVRDVSEKLKSEDICVTQKPGLNSEQGDMPHREMDSVVGELMPGSGRETPLTPPPGYNIHSDSMSVSDSRLIDNNHSVNHLVPRAHSAKPKGTRVRFADNLAQDIVEIEDVSKKDSNFFVTEDEVQDGGRDISECSSVSEDVINRYASMDDLTKIPYFYNREDMTHKVTNDDVLSVNSEEDQPIIIDVDITSKSSSDKLNICDA